MLSSQIDHFLGGGPNSLVQSSSVVFVHVSVLLLFNQLFLLTQKGITEHLRMELRGMWTLVALFTPDPGPQETLADRTKVKSRLKVFW